MYKNLKEKIDYEWKKYICYLRLMSVADVITHAYEIAAKTAIFNRLITDVTVGTMDDSLSSIYMNTNDIIDTLFFRAKEKELVILTNGTITDELWEQIKHLLEL